MIYQFHGKGNGNEISTSGKFGSLEDAEQFAQEIAEQFGLEKVNISSNGELLLTLADEPSVSGLPELFGSIAEGMKVINQIEDGV